MSFSKLNVLIRLSRER